MKLHFEFAIQSLIFMFVFDDSYNFSLPIFSHFDNVFDNIGYIPLYLPNSVINLLYNFVPSGGLP